MLLVVVDPVAGEIDVVVGVIDKTGEAAGQLPRGVDHEVDDAVVAVLQQLLQHARLLHVGFQVAYAGNRLFRVDQGDCVHPVSHGGQAGNQILPHRAGCAENENFLRMIHLTPLNAVELHRPPEGGFCRGCFQNTTRNGFLKSPRRPFLKKDVQTGGCFRKKFHRRANESNSAQRSLPCGPRMRPPSMV